MRIALLLLLLTPFLTQTPATNTGIIEGKVTRPSSAEGVPDVQVTLIGPSSSAALGPLYTPNASLTPAMRDQIDALINSAPPGISLEVVANAAMRMEAQLLGLPVPPTVASAGGAVAQPPQTAVVTDREGAFSFKNLAPGRYQLRAQRDGYFGAPPAGSVGVGAPTIVNLPVTVVAGQPTSAVSITMLRGAIVSGRVRDPNGQPLTTSQISAYQINYQNGRKVLQQVNSKQTDDRGEYRLYWLPPGDYLIGSVPRRLAGQAPTAQDNYARTFFPNMVDARQAQIIRAREGGEISGIDINVRADATGKISGKVITSVLAANGQPPLASIFYLQSADPSALADSGVSSVPNAATNRTGGQFELRGILPGEYDLLSNVPDGNGRQVWGRTRVNVNGELNDVTLSLQPGIEVRVRLSVDGAPPAYTMQTPPAGARGTFVSVINGIATTTATAPQAPAGPVPTPTYRVQFRSPASTALTSPWDNAANQDMAFDPASGSLVFKSVLPGKYAISVLPLPPNGYVADIRGGGASIDNSEIDISSQVGEIEVLVKTDGRRIEGVVRDTFQNAVALARVALVPASMSRRQNVQLYKTVVTQNTGSFTITGVAPGEYKLFAWESAPNTAWMDAEFLAPYETRGQTVNIGATATTTVDLRLIPSPNPTK